jgi:hypothetical protein
MAADNLGRNPSELMVMGMDGTATRDLNEAERITESAADHGDL